MIMLLRKQDNQPFCRLSALGMLALVTGAFIGCTPGAVSKEMAKTPDIPDQEVCNPAALGSVMSPLVMQWPTAARADIESAMQDGIVVINYSCSGIKVLQDCRVDGEYGYRAITPKTDEALIEGRDNIGASFGGGAFAVSGNIDRAAKLDLSYMLVGKRATTRSSVYRDELEGEDFCKGATHFVKRVDIGAWAMVSGKGVTAGLAAKVMGQGVEAASNSKEMRAKTDGDPNSCKGATREDPTPPGGCGALIRVTMAPIKSAGGPSKADSITNRGLDDDAGCPEGFSFSSDGMCVQDGGDEAVLCSEDDEADCKKQCLAGSDESCNRYANQLMYPEGQESSEEDLKAALPKIKAVLERQKEACLQSDQPSSCMLVAAHIFAPVDADDKEAMVVALKELVPYGNQACVAGEPKACGLMRIALGNPQTSAALGFEETSYRKMLARGCAGGGAVPCGQLAFEHAVGGQQFDRDPAKALKMAKEACLGDFAPACLLQSALLSDEAGCGSAMGALDQDTKDTFDTGKVCEADNLSAVNDDAKAAKRAKSRACAFGFDAAC